MSQPLSLQLEKIRIGNKVIVCRVIRDSNSILEITRQSAIGPVLEILQDLGGAIRCLPFISLRGVRPRDYLRDRLYADRIFLLYLTILVKIIRPGSFEVKLRSLKMGVGTMNN
jgi:hypothetical protein